MGLKYQSPHIVLYSQHIVVTIIKKIHAYFMVILHIMAHSCDAAFPAKIKKLVYYFHKKTGKVQLAASLILFIFLCIGFRSVKQSVRQAGR